MGVYASGKLAHGFCDVCGFRYPLKSLRETILNLKPTGILSCPTCWDPDHPQLQVGRHKVFDPQSLRRPRPDPAMLDSRGDDEFLGTENDDNIADEDGDTLII